MAEPKIYPKGFVCFKKHKKAPDFVKGGLVININQFNDWLAGEGNQYLTEYNGEAQIKLQITEWEGKPVFTVDTYKKS